MKKRSEGHEFKCFIMEIKEFFQKLTQIPIKTSRDQTFFVDLKRSCLDWEQVLGKCKFVRHVQYFIVNSTCIYPFAAYVYICSKRSEHLNMLIMQLHYYKWGGSVSDRVRIMFC